MEARITPASFQEACAILFGPDVSVTTDFLRELDEGGLRSAYHSKAKETHPDRAMALGLDRDALHRNFLKVSWAYRQIKSELDDPGLLSQDMDPDSDRDDGLDKDRASAWSWAGFARWAWGGKPGDGDESQDFGGYGAGEEQAWEPDRRGDNGRSSAEGRRSGMDNPGNGNGSRSRAAGSADGGRSEGFRETRREPGRQEPRERRAAQPGPFRFDPAAFHRFYKGPLPMRRLRIGEFLYYSGLISWRDFIASLVWQRQSRPSFGQIAVDWRLFPEDDILRVLRSKNLGERFGEAALRLGLINDFWRRTVLLRQSKIQPLLGRYFLDQGILSTLEMRRVLHSLALHNLGFPDYDRV